MKSAKPNRSAQDSDEEREALAAEWEALAALHATRVTVVSGTVTHDAVCCCQEMLAELDALRRDLSVKWAIERDRAVCRDCHDMRTTQHYRQRLRTLLAIAHKLRDERDRARDTAARLRDEVTPAGDLTPGARWWRSPGDVLEVVRVEADGRIRLRDPSNSIGGAIYPSEAALRRHYTPAGRPQSIERPAVPTDEADRERGASAPPSVPPGLDVAIRRTVVEWLAAHQSPKEAE